MDCKVFQALSEEIRLRILLLLASGEINVTQLTRSLGAPQPTVSRHLKVLSDAGIVRSVRKGKQVYYSIEIPGIKEAQDFITGLIQASSSKPLAKSQSGTTKRRLRQQAIKSGKSIESIKVRSSDWDDRMGQIGPIGQPEMDDFLL